MKYRKLAILLFMGVCFLSGFFVQRYFTAQEKERKAEVQKYIDTEREKLNEAKTIVGQFILGNDRSLIFLVNDYPELETRTITISPGEEFYDQILLELGLRNDETTRILFEFPKTFEEECL